MIKHTVQPGDMIAVLAVRYKTTIRIIMQDNPFIPKSQELQPGWRLDIYSPEENAKRHTETAYDQIKEAHELKEKIYDSKYLTQLPKEPVPYKDRLVFEGQAGFAKTIEEVPMYHFQSNGYRKRIRTLPKGSILRVYEEVMREGESFFLVNDYEWIPSSPSKVLYEPISVQDLEGKIRLNQNPALLGMSRVMPLTASVNAQAKLIQPNARFGYGPKPSPPSSNIAPRTFIGAGTMKSYKANDGLASIPSLEAHAFKRPILRMKNADGETKAVELRALGFSANYANRVQPSNTNAGWFINVRASDLPTLTITGFLMETKTADEFNDFMSRYRRYLEAKKSGDFYSLGISTLFFKRIEYQGIIVGFNFTDRSEETLHRKYTLQMMVLKEKSLSYSDLSGIKTVVNRRGKTERAFRSDIGSMLANTVTGAYFTDFY